MRIKLNKVCLQLKFFGELREIFHRHSHQIAAVQGYLVLETVYDIKKAQGNFKLCKGQIKAIFRFD